MKKFMIVFVALFGAGMYWKENIYKKTNKKEKKKRNPQKEMKQFKQTTQCQK